MNDSHNNNSSNNSNHNSISLFVLTHKEAPFNLVGSDEFTPLETTIFLSLAIPIVLFTIISNAFVVKVIRTYPPLMTPSYLFLLSLSSTDMFSGVIMSITCFYNVAGVWYFGKIGCQLWSCLTFLFNTSSVHHLAAIAIDRYRAITQPMSYGTKRSNRKSLSIIGVVWLCSLLTTLPPYITGWGMMWPEVFTEDTVCTLPTEPSYVIYAELGSFYLPLLIIVGVYLKLFLLNRARVRKKIKRETEIAELTANRSDAASKDNGPLPGNNAAATAAEPPVTTNTAAAEEENKNASSQQNPCMVKNMVQGSKRRQLLSNCVLDLAMDARKCQQCRAGIIPKVRRNVSNLCQICSNPNDLIVAARRSRLEILLQKERRSMFVCSIIICTFIFCLWPGWTLYIVMSLYPTLDINSRFVSIVWWLLYSNSACNPVIYTIFNKDFRDAFLKMLGRKN